MTASGPPHLTAEDVLATPYPVAVAALEQALLAGAGSGDPRRSVVDVPGGQILFMPSSGKGFAGVKLVTIAPDNPVRGLPRIQGTFLLFDGETLGLLATMDAAALTQLRTPAVSALAARSLAPPDAAHLVVFGTGPQALGHLEALAAQHPLRRVGVVGRRADAASEILARAGALGLSASSVTPDAVAEADVVVTATTAREPLFDGALLQDSALVVAVGTHEPDARELDGTTVRRCQVVVEDREVAAVEAGDLLMAAKEGMAIDLVGDLRELVRGLPIGLDRPRLFKSVGMAWEDLAVATAVYRRWRGGENEEPRVPIEEST